MAEIKLVPLTPNDRDQFMKRLRLLLLAGFLLLTGCGFRGQIMDGDGMVNSYKQISQEEAREMMERNDGHVVVDVRRQDEYDAGHIPGAILIPNESIGDERPEELPDLSQIILIYCRSGNRSKQASQKLFDMGYTNVYEFGGIITWTGEIVTEESTESEIWTADELPVSLRYDRLWEYGEYCETTDAEQIEEIVAAIRALKVGAQSDVCVDDYTDILTFSFADGTTLTLEFEGQSWVKDTDTRYSVEGLSRLRNLLDEVLEEQTSNAMRPVPTLVIESNRHIFYATLADNSSAEVFAEKLSGGPIEIDMHDYGSFEKVGALPWSLPTNDESITTTPGDVILYQGNQLTIYYDENTWSFTRLAKIDGLTKRELLDAFGDGNVTVKLWVEWSE